MNKASELSVDALPDCPYELQALLGQVRDRVRRNRDTTDMRLAVFIERLLAEKTAVPANANTDTKPQRQQRQRRRA